jgi:hypothetical protein
MLVYKKASHRPHRHQVCFGNPPSEEWFKQILSDILQIAQGVPPVGTQDLSELSNGTALVQDACRQEGSMRFFAQRSNFVRLNATNELEPIPFQETECGQEILEAMEEKDATDF